MKNLKIIIAIALCMVSCTEGKTEFNDSVTAALARNGVIDFNNMEWTREPAAYSVKEDTIAVTTAPHRIFGSALIIISAMTMLLYSRCRQEKNISVSLSRRISLRAITDSTSAES